MSRYSGCPHSVCSCGMGAQPWCSYLAPGMAAAGVTADVTANRHGGNEFSKAANLSLPNKAAMRAKILMLIAAHGDKGATCDEIEYLTGWSHQSVSARFSELKIAEQILPAGRRPTRSGRSAGVWVAAPVQETLPLEVAS